MSEQAPWCVVLDGAGNSDANGRYYLTEYKSFERPVWAKGEWKIKWTDSGFWIIDQPGPAPYRILDPAHPLTLPLDGKWVQYERGGDEPFPKMSYILVEGGEEIRCEEKQVDLRSGDPVIVLDHIRDGRTEDGKMAMLEKTGDIKLEGRRGFSGKMGGGGVVLTVDSAEAIVKFYYTDGGTVNVKVPQASFPNLGKMSIQTLLPMLEGSDERVKVMACQLLGEAAPQGDEVVKKALLAMLQNEDQGSAVRAATCQAFAGFVSKGDEEVIKAMLPLMRQATKANGIAPIPETEVKQACRSLGQVALQGDEKVIDVLLPKLEDGNPEIEQLAITSIGKVAKQGDAQALLGLRNLIVNANHAREPRMAACKLISELSTQGDAAVLEALESCKKRAAELDEEDVRAVAEEAVNKVGST